MSLIKGKSIGKYISAAYVDADSGGIEIYSFDVIDICVYL